ncbi:MAG: hypothetical protein L7F77_15070 [Candidatus Magnetominusculus sp. LBB02]|nr:hypothetical protein [Candidatus Magnetominusculus sp. LBB02]
MTIWSVVIIVCIIIIVLALTLINRALHNNTKSALVKRFQDRAELSPDEFYRRYYESSGLPKDQVIEILNEIAHALIIPAGLLRPCDRFDNELKPIIGFLFADDCRDDLGMKLYDLVDIKDPDYQGKDIRNIDDYIRCVIELQQMEPTCKNIPSSGSKYILFILAVYGILFISFTVLSKRNSDAVAGVIMTICIIHIILELLYYLIKKKGTGRQK